MSQSPLGEAPVPGVAGPFVGRGDPVSIASRRSPGPGFPQHRLGARRRAVSIASRRSPGPGPPRRLGWGGPPVSIASRRSPGPGVRYLWVRDEHRVSIASRRSPGPGGAGDPSAPLQVSIASRRSPGPGYMAALEANALQASQSPLGEAPVPGRRHHGTRFTQRSQSPLGEAPVPGGRDVPRAWKYRKSQSPLGEAPVPGFSILRQGRPTPLSQSPLGEAPVPGVTKSDLLGALVSIASRRSPGPGTRHPPLKRWRCRLNRLSAKPRSRDRSREVP